MASVTENLQTIERLFVERYIERFIEDCQAESARQFEKVKRLAPTERVAVALLSGLAVHISRLDPNWSEYYRLGRGPST
jgi:hypothetical protein